MTRLFWPSPEPAEYQSRFWFASQTIPGVRLRLRRMSFQRRIELGRAVKELAARLEFEGAIPGTASQIEQSLIAAEIDAVYFRWGVEAIDGLRLDGATADMEAALRDAPVAFIREAVDRIKRECGLSETERKN